jgi:DNA repair photolyase
VPFEYSLNPYRGCEHGCSYCYARPSHEFLGFSAGLDFETKILVKEAAPDLLRAELCASSWRPQIIALSGVTDPYQPIERRIRLTRKCLEVLLEFRNPVGIITKNHLVTRDADLLAELASFEAVSVILSITTLDVDLARRMEPRASHPRRRLAAIERLAEAGIPVGVNVAPVIPGLTDYEIPAILRASADAGASFAGFVMLRLPHGVKDLFSDWLEQHRPDRRHRVLERIREMRGGSLNDTAFGRRMRGTGLYAGQIARLFEVGRRKVGLKRSAPKLSSSCFVRPGQMALF